MLDMSRYSRLVVPHLGLLSDSSASAKKGKVRFKLKLQSMTSWMCLCPFKSGKWDGHHLVQAFAKGRKYQYITIPAAIEETYLLANRMDI